MHKHKILVIDDKINMLKLLRRILDKEFEVTTSDGGRQGLKVFKEDQFDLVVSDIKMPDIDGITLLKEIKTINPDVVVILITAYATVSSAVEAIKAGAYDYIKKPFDPDELMIIIKRALERKELVERTKYLEREVEGVFHFRNVVGKSSAMEAVYSLVRRVINSDTTVLISGESGTGKELVARAIHYESKRSRNRFVAVNCGAIPKDLLESEMFGHVKGAFSGAHSSKKGLTEEAEGGTLFLDEIGELGQDLQVKINRFLQEKEIRPVGANQDRVLDVRVIAATNIDLKDAVADNRFREDLFYRLNVYPISVPPLRERKDDIPILVAYFIDKYKKREEKKIGEIDPDALDILTEYDWPGNVRELENVIERAVLLEEGPRITAHSLPKSLTSESPVHHEAEVFMDLPYKKAMETATDQFARNYLERLLRKFQGNVTKASSQAGMERESLHRLMRRYDIQSDEFKD